MPRFVADDVSPIEVDMVTFTTRKGLVCDPLRSRVDIIYISTSTFKIDVKSYPVLKIVNLNINQIASHLTLSGLRCAYLAFQVHS